MVSLFAIALFYHQLLKVNQTPAVIQDYIVVQSIIHGVDPQLSLSIVKRESQFNPHAVGDGGTSYGLWQIHLPAHPSISPENAQDIEFSTEWSLGQLEQGKCHIWSTCPLLAMVDT